MQAITSYFEAERAESLLFIAVGLLALVLAAVFWRVLKKPFFNGMAVSLALVAAIQLSVGGMVLVRTPQDIARVQQMLQTERSRLQNEEVPRMQVVMKNFDIYRWTEIALLLLGLLLLMLAAPSSAWRGAGLGLALQAGLMLGLDYFAEQRGSVYLAWLATAR